MVSNNKPMIMAANDGAKPQRKRQWGWVKPLVWQAPGQLHPAVGLVQRLLSPRAFCLCAQDGAKNQNQRLDRLA